MEKKLFAIECENVALVVRPNGDTVIVTEAAELVLDNAVMEQIVRNSGAYKSFVITKDEVISALEYENTNLQNTIVGLEEQLKKAKADKDSLQQKLVNANIIAQPMVKGRVVNQEGCYLYDINGDFLADCGTERRAIKVQKMLYEGKIRLDMVMEIFGSSGGKKRRVDDVATGSESSEE